jgi:hypothetical protein
MASKARNKIMDAERKKENVIPDSVFVRWLLAASKESGSFRSAESLVDLYNKKRLDAVYALVELGLPVGLQQKLTSELIKPGLIYKICIDADPDSLTVLGNVLAKIESGRTEYYIDTEIEADSKKGTATAFCNTKEKLMLLVTYGARVGLSEDATDPSTSKEAIRILDNLPLETIRDVQKAIKKYKPRKNFLIAHTVAEDE